MKPFFSPMIVKCITNIRHKNFVIALVWVCLSLSMNISAQLRSSVENYDSLICFKNKNLTADDFMFLFSFPKGIGGLDYWLLKHVQYPEDAINKYVVGIVYVDFDVAPNGKISNVKIANSLYPSLDQEALRLFNLMPNLIPGKKLGKTITHMKVQLFFNSSLFNSYLKKSPSFKGGDEKMEKWINSNMHFPDAKLRDILKKSLHANNIKRNPNFVYKNLKLDAEVIVGVTIDVNGKLGDVHIVDSANEALDEEALRLVRNMPDWKPAKIDGNYKKVNYCIPIRFNKRKEQVEMITRFSNITNGVTDEDIWIKDNIQIPNIVKECNLTDQVVVSYIIERDGETTNFYIEHPSSFQSLNDEAIRLAKTFPKYYSKEKNGVEGVTYAKRFKKELLIDFGKYK